MCGSGSAKQGGGGQGCLECAVSLPDIQNRNLDRKKRGKKPVRHVGPAQSFMGGFKRFALCKRLFLQDLKVVHPMLHGRFDKEPERHHRGMGRQKAQVGPGPLRISLVAVLRWQVDKSEGNTTADFCLRSRRFPSLSRRGAGESGFLKKRLDKKKGLWYYLVHS